MFSGKKLAKSLGYALAGLLLVSFVGVFWLSRDLPDPNKLIERQIAQSTKIYDRTGKNVLYEVHGDQRRTLVALSDVPDYLKNATTAIEDKDFYKHRGFSLWAIFRTVVTDILRGQRAGGSTLTQQFIKNAVLTNEKTFTRKIKELILAYRLEQKFSKDEILQMYLNEIPYGSTAYGVEAASQKYFGKNVKEISLAEAAILAALPQAPSRYSPYGPNKDLLIGRQRYILDQLVKQGYLNQDQAEAAKKTELKFKRPTENMLAPHFVMYVKELLSEKYGDKMVEQGGLKIYTTLDLDKQKIAEEVINEKAPKNEEKYQATNAALISLDPKTGQILAMVGSKDYWSTEIDGQYNVVTSQRQPGSSFKPIVYAASFLRGYTPDTVLEDIVTNFSTDPAKPYEPHDYDLKERGPITVRQALAGSLNIPAVKMIYLAGINNVLDLADKLGYTTLKDRSRFGLSLVLGGGEVKLLEHANAFGAFAREGELHATTPILKVEDKDGKILEEYKEKKELVFEPQIARQITGILSDNSARAFIFGENNFLTLPDRPVAAKTGTTNDYKDAWTMGYTPSLVTGVWVGNNDFKSMKKGADGSVVAAPIWHDYMKRVLAGTAAESFNPPEQVVTGKPVLDGNVSGDLLVKLDRTSGLLASADTPASQIEEKTFRQIHSILYYVNKDDPRGPAPANPAADPQFELWENRVLAWAAKQGFATSSPPNEYDNLHQAEYRPNLTVETPENNQTVGAPFLSAKITASAPRGINRAEYYLDDKLFTSNYFFPFDLNKSIDFLINGFHKLTIRVCDDIDNCSEATREFNLSVANNNNSAGEEINLSFIDPASGLAVRANDFPLSLKLSLTNPKQSGRLDLYYLGQTASSTPILIASLMPLESAFISAKWSRAPLLDTYRIYAELYGWNGQYKKIDGPIIVIGQPPRLIEENKNKP